MLHQRCYLLTYRASHTDYLARSIQLVAALNAYKIDTILIPLPYGLRTHIIVILILVIGELLGWLLP